MVPGDTYTEAMARLQDSHMEYDELTDLIKNCYCLLYTSSGINPVRTKFLAYVINGMIAGLAGMLWICKFGNAQGESCSSYELNVIASVVLGGVFITGG